MGLHVWRVDRVASQIKGKVKDMGTVAFFEKLFLNTNKWIRKSLVGYGERKNIRRKKTLISSVKLSKEQKKEIDCFFKKNYGKKIPSHWHRLYQSYTGKFRYNYFPEILFSTKLEPLWNPYRIAEFLGDKNLLHTLFGTVQNLHIPKTFLSSVRGVLRDSDNKIIDFEGAVDSIKNIGYCVIKKTIDTSSGRDVIVANLIGDRDEKSGQSINDLLLSFGADFVVQERVVQSEVLNQFNSSSLNTFRVITYLLEGQVKVCPIALRLGRNNAEKDNIHYGGISIGVDFNGEIREFAFSEYGEKLSAHPDSKVVFLGKTIPQISEIIKITKELHQCVPYLGVVSWDMSLDENDTPVLIEMNTTGQSAWFCQMVNGEPLFGDDTAKILSIIKKK